MKPNWTIRLRQLQFPPPIRIEPMGGDADWSLALASALIEANSTVDKANLALKVAANKPDQPPLEPQFVKALCNEYFRLRRAAEAIKDARALQRRLDDLRDIFEKYQIECIDLASQRFDEGREDFEPISEAEIDPTLEHKTIIRCERPLVKYQGQMLQRAKGLVARPA